MTMPRIRPVFSGRCRERRFARPVRRQRASSRRSSPAALHEQGLVDRLVAHLHHRIACELDPQPGRGLLR
jgi:hypothetical protein